MICLAAAGCTKKADNEDYGYFAVYNTDGKFGFIDQSGKIVMDYQYDRARSFSEGLAAVCRDQKYGYINKAGEVVIDFQYKEAYDFKDGLACVMNDSGLCGYINPSGDVDIDFQFESKSNFSEGRAAVRRQDGMYGYIDKKGELVIPYKYSGVQSFSDGLALVWNYDDDKTNYKYIDKDGNEVITPDCTEASSFYNGRAAVKTGLNWSYIDKNGKTVSGKLDKYSLVNPMRDGMALVKKKDKWGYINAKGKQVIDCQYDYAESFSNGLAFVSNSDEKTAEAFVINKKGEAVYTYPKIDLTKNTAEPELTEPEENAAEAEQTAGTDGEAAE